MLGGCERLTLYGLYDSAGVLTPAETQALEHRAADLTASGTPVVVYLRVQDTSQTQARDASDLMDAWNVRSAADARDPLVILMNLRPDDPHHGLAGNMSELQFDLGQAVPYAVAMGQERR
jgi:hypothetical protein